MKKIIWIIIIIVIILIGISKYNSFVRIRVEVDNKWAEVENQLQRRYDLIPNYVNTVKGYAEHEKEVFIKVTEARSKVGQASSREEKINANNELSGALSRLLVVIEKYPDLKANVNFIRLQDELSGTENRLAVARKRYNEIVSSYNQRIMVFPNNLIAKIFGFKQEAFYKTPEEAKTAPKVEF
ncbi:MAG: LemA family protein [Candidatus Cloacimonadota bacterium]|nr:MAG: LemA family protein [Candidatus Cloacimonadota bacterium]